MRDQTHSVQRMRQTVVRAPPIGTNRRGLVCGLNDLGRQGFELGSASQDKQAGQRGGERKAADLRATVADRLEVVAYALHLAIELRSPKQPTGEFCWIHAGAENVVASQAPEPIRYKHRRPHPERASQAALRAESIRSLLNLGPVIRRPPPTDRGHHGVPAEQLDAHADYRVRPQSRGRSNQ